MPLGADKFTELPQTVNELVADRAIRHALYLERYKTHLVEELLKEFNSKLEPALKAKIEKSLRRVSGTSKQLQALFRDNGELVREEYKVIQAKLYEQLEDFSEVETSWLVKTLRTQTPIAWNFVAPSDAMLKALVMKQPMEGALVKDWFKKLSVDTAFAVNRQIQMGMVEGEGIDDIVRRIKGTRAAHYDDGILGKVSRPHLRSVVRTSVSHVSHHAREETYKANTDIIKAVQIMATLDTRTCVACMDWDGNTYPVGKGPRPPKHWSGRCTDVPVLKSWRELGIPAKDASASTRASMTGQVSETLTYSKWLKRQKKSVQIEAFGGKKAGREKADLFRDGKLKISQFTDVRNRPLSLAKLRRLAKR